MKSPNKAKEKVVYAGDIVPLSFSDFLGEPACVIFLAGCNFDCGYCQNWQLKRASEDNITDLEMIKRVLSENKLITACKVTGGEPLLQLDAVIEIGKFAKSLGLKFGIDTNGSLSEALARVAPLLDLISIDIKTELNEREYTKITRVQPPPISSIKRSLEIAMRSEAYVDIRMVVIPGYNDDIAKIKAISKMLRDLGYEEKATKGMASFVLIEFVPENATDDEFRRINNPSVSLLSDLAKSSDLSNVRITHRGTGFYKSVS